MWNISLCFNVFEGTDVHLESSVNSEAAAEATAAVKAGEVQTSSKDQDQGTAGPRGAKKGRLSMLRTTAQDDASLNLSTTPAPQERHAVAPTAQDKLH